MLTKKEIKTLRNEIVLNSLYTNDYKNSLHIKSKTAMMFFDSYMEYLYEIAHDDNFNSDDVIDVINKYDTLDNLYNYYLCYDDDPLLKDDYIAMYNDTIYTGCLIYDVVDDKILVASYYTHKFGYMVINKLTKNKVYYDSVGDSYIIKDKNRYYLSQFIKVNIGN